MTPRAHSFSLAGRTALITGASAGLGAHFGRLYAEAGARVILGARRLDRVQALADRLDEAGLEALAVTLDVTSESSVRNAYDDAEARFGTVDTVLANAGMSAGGRATEVAEGDLHALVQTNFTGVYLTAREGARRMILAGERGRESGRIVLMGSITAHLTGQGDSAYAATKAAVAHLGRSLAREWVRRGINVNVVQPGYIRTEIIGNWFDTEDGLARIAGFHRRRLLKATALDDMLLYLSSDASRCVTGAVIDIDDGQSL